MGANDLANAAAAYDRGDHVTALRLFRALADQGLPLAQSMLAYMYENGEGVAQSYPESARWYRAAAEQGHALSQLNLGLMYAQGEGVPLDSGEAARWLRLSAFQGNPVAQYNLGVAYFKGAGVPQDYASAMKWYLLAGNQGEPLAQLNLGLMYALGNGVSRDHSYAYLWFTLSATSGMFDAVQNRERAARLLTPEQMSSAEELLREWRQVPPAKLYEFRNAMVILAFGPTVKFQDRELKGKGWPSEDDMKYYEEGLPSMGSVATDYFSHTFLGAPNHEATTFSVEGRDCPAIKLSWPALIHPVEMPPVSEGTQSRNAVDALTNIFAFMMGSQWVERTVIVPEPKLDLMLKSDPETGLSMASSSHRSGSNSALRRLLDAIMRSLRGER